MNAWLDRLIDMGLAADAACWDVPRPLDWEQTENKSKLGRGSGNFRQDGDGLGKGDSEYPVGYSRYQLSDGNYQSTGYGTGNMAGSGAGNLALDQQTSYPA